jgi:hypothetical protein
MAPAPAPAPARRESHGGRAPWIAEPARIGDGAGRSEKASIVWLQLSTHRGHGRAACWSLASREEEGGGDEETAARAKWGIAIHKGTRRRGGRECVTRGDNQGEGRRRRRRPSQRNARADKGEWETLHTCTA